ncbi:MAG: hypothetical protein LIO70_01955, partial [Clostridiales bacterium]|nr:hypothetical protein [Clostridiales bacterium]
VTGRSWRPIASPVGAIWQNDEDFPGENRKKRLFLFDAGRVFWHNKHSGVFCIFAWKGDENLMDASGRSCRSDGTDAPVPLWVKVKGLSHLRAEALC